MFAPARLGGGTVVTGALYFPSLSWEKNVIAFLERKVESVSKAVRGFRSPETNDFAIVTTQSSNGRNLAENSIDYIFVDPPFGGNLMYSELNLVWESWLKVKTNSTSEAIVSNSQRKDAANYLALMESCFREFHYALKPNRWMTVEFHNSKNAVWNAIQEAILRAGFVVADVRVLDKQQTSFKQQTSVSIAKQDLVISAYKPSAQFEQRFLAEAGTEQGAWDFVRQHLSQLPVFVEKAGAVEIISERQNYLLFDRMVAFHIQRGSSVPINAAEFYDGLRQRFSERDGMFFLPEQVAEYDAKRARVAQVEQLSLFVSDEKSAVQWLRVHLENRPQTYQEIQPQFLQELHQARHEQLPELIRLLEENFVKDAKDCWYVPDPSRGEDLEKLRERGLLREFEAYTAVKGKLKTFRTEAVRAGFKAAWAKRDYRTIIDVARRLPEDVLQEDASLLMYYDNSAMRSEQ